MTHRAKESAPWREKNWRTVEAWVGVGIGGSRMIVAGGKIHRRGAETRRRIKRTGWFRTALTGSLLCLSFAYTLAFVW